MDRNIPPVAAAWLLALLGLTATLTSSTAHAAFNPNSGADAALASTATLPDPAAIYGGSLGASTPLSPVPLPIQPLYPDRIQPPLVADPLASAAPTTAVPMVAAAPLSATPATTTTTTDAPAAGFIAPAPVLADNPLAQTASPSAMPPIATTPLAAAPIPATPEKLADIPIATTSPTALLPTAAIASVSVPPVTTPELSPQTRAILSHVPGHLDTVHPAAGSLAINRVDPAVKDALGKKDKVESYEATGISIQVRRPGLDENFELNRAYTALMGGDSDTAIETYKNILSVNPRSQDALFGLAATYHRLGSTDKARPLYGTLLQVNPNHREGLNNFLSLVSDEAPQDALPELERLEARNPHFSPIPAQIGMLLDKLGYADASRTKMLRAIELSPENLTYKYNLAVMLDRRGQSADALALYNLLIDASLHGQAIPAPTAALQKRVNYLTAALNKPAIAAAPPTVTTATVN